jgi:hypothetical protein
VGDDKTKKSERRPLVSWQDYRHVSCVKNRPSKDPLVLPPLLASLLPPPAIPTPGTGHVPVSLSPRSLLQGGSNQYVYNLGSGSVRHRFRSEPPLGICLVLNLGCMSYCSGSRSGTVELGWGCPQARPPPMMLSFLSLHSAPLLSKASGRKQIASHT